MRKSSPGSFKALSDFNHPNWHRAVPYTAFVNVKSYLASLAFGKFDYRQDIHRAFDESMNEKSFNELFLHYDTLQYPIPKRFLEVMGYDESLLHQALKKDIEAWEMECRKYTEFPSSFVWAIHTFFSVSEEFPIDAKSIDDKIDVMIAERNKGRFPNSNIWYCGINMKPLASVQTNRVGVVSICSYKPEMTLDDKEMYHFDVTSDGVIYPDWLMDSKYITDALNAHQNACGEITLKFGNKDITNLFLKELK